MVVIVEVGLSYCTGTSTVLLDCPLIVTLTLALVPDVAGSVIANCATSIPTLPASANAAVAGAVTPPADTVTASTML